MLEKPALDDQRLIDCLRADFGIPIHSVSFLPLGADVATAVYRATAVDGTPYFVKLRRGEPDELTVAVPALLAARGVRQVIAPLPARGGRRWSHLPLDDFSVTVYPFVDGANGWERPLSDRQWHELGRALRALHALELPAELAGHMPLPRETYTGRWREEVRAFQRQVEVEMEGAGDADHLPDRIAVELAAFLRARRPTIDALLARTEQLAAELRTRPPAAVLCHGDIHAGNVLLDGDAGDGALFVVDWDTLILAPKERDLMFIGGGIGGSWNTPREEQRFYEGYGRVEVDAVALVYYRYERVVQDIAAFCEQLLWTGEGGADRAQSLRFVVGTFAPVAELAIAQASDRRLLGGGLG